MKTIPVRRGFTEIEPLFNFLAKRDAFICGGYARYCASPNLNTPEAGDVDIYLRTEEAFDPLAAGFKDAGLEVKHENENCITYKRTAEGAFAFAPTIQLIKPINRGAMFVVGEPEDIINNFDFPVTRAVITSPTTVLVDDDFEQDELDKRLQLKNIHCPISSMYRAFKYMKKGYWMPPKQTLLLFLDWEGRSDDYRANITAKLQKEGELSKEDINELEKLLWVD